MMSRRSWAVSSNPPSRAPKLTMAPEHVAAGFELQQLGARP
jgi:hypothetical protein